MKNTITTLILLVGLVCNAQLMDEPDKRTHAAAGAFFSTPVVGFTFQKTNDYKKSFLNGVYTSIAFGVGKEVYDSTQAGNRFDNRDVLATVIGGVVSSAITTGIIYLTNKKKKRIR